jgi:tRNA threonylcarbamoyladenosine biosynthesis protein TsaE
VEGTLELGERIAEMLQPPMVVILRGEVGAGKTTLVKGIAAALGAAAEDEVTSPTFTIVHEYVGTSVRLFHLDLYRLETEEQVAVLGLDEMAGYPDSLVLVEWGERFESIVKRAGAEIYMEHGEGDERGLIVRLKELR